MTKPYRIALYLVLAVLLAVFGHRFVGAFSATMDRGLLSDREAALESIDGASVRPVTEEPGAEPASDESVTNDAVEPGTNDVAVGATGGDAAGSPTNGVPPQTKTKAPVDRSSGLGLYGALTFACLLGLALMIGRDVSHYFADRTHRELYNDEGEGLSDPEYDEAEQVWADGDHLGAIRLLREQLQKRPKLLHAAIRIAEIYEKDLNNPLAAALEYEEVLKHKFDSERWGWAAIHLCNLYVRLNQPEKMEALMRRIVQEVPETGAAKKARVKLGIPEDAELPDESESSTPAGSASASGSESPDVAEGDFKMPRGFKPKKG
ncbi:MAG: tetratricopeptide repeat protein [Limisphaerales bacterium]